MQGVAVVTEGGRQPIKSPAVDTGTLPFAPAS